VASKKQGIRASAGSPIDFVSAAGTVQVRQNFISRTMVTHIDFGLITRLSGLPSQLIKPSELCTVIFYLGPECHLIWAVIFLNLLANLFPMDKSPL